MKKIVCALFMVAFATACTLRNTADATELMNQHIAGSITIIPDEGYLAGKVCVTGVEEKYQSTFLLNKGLNIAHVRTMDGKSIQYGGEHEFLDGAMVGEGIQYTPRPRENSDLEKGVCVEYVGAFPVYDTSVEEKIIDFKGLIAFDGSVMRATEQSKWYPIPFDVDSGREASSFTYDLHITCKDCSGLYMNGSDFSATSDARFVSEISRPLVIFAGDVNFQENNGIRLFNLEVDEQAAKVMRAHLNKASEFFEKITALPMGEQPNFVGMQLLQAYSGLSFASWPTIALGNVKDLSVILSEDRSHLTDYWEKTLVHEMGHYYFGTVFSNVGPLRMVFGETFPEWMSIKFIAEEFGQETADEIMSKHYSDAIKIDNWKPLNEISSSEETNERYRYRYTPLLIMKLEEMIGAERMGKLIEHFLGQPHGVQANYDLLVIAAKHAGVTDEEWRQFERACIEPAPVESCIKDFQ